MAKAKTTKKVSPKAASKKRKSPAKSSTRPKAKTTKTKTKTTTRKKPSASKDDEEVIVDRRNVQQSDRREADRRQTIVAVDEERRSNPQRRKVARRRQIDPTTCERDYNNDEIEFMHALDAYKRAAGRMFPTCSEILEVIRDLGYRRLSPEELAKLGPMEVSNDGDQANLVETDKESSQDDGFERIETATDRESSSEFFAESSEDFDD